MNSIKTNSVRKAFDIFYSKENKEKNIYKEIVILQNTNNGDCECEIIFNY